MGKIVFSFLLSFFSMISLYAEFEILETHDVIYGCDGSVAVLANGSAGPFEIKFIDSNTQGIVAIKENVSDYTFFEDICAGSYDLIAYSSDGCSFFIGTAVFELQCMHHLMGEEGIQANVIDFFEPTFGNCDGSVSFSLEYVNGTIDRINLFGENRNLIKR